MFSLKNRAKEIALTRCADESDPAFLEEFARAVEGLVTDSIVELVDEIQRLKLRESKFIASQTCEQLVEIIKGRARQ